MPQKLKIDIPLVLPDVTDATDACVGRLLEELGGQPGVEDVHVAPGGEGGTEGAGETLCIHYDPDLISLSRIRELADAAGARITRRFGHLLWQVEKPMHQRRARTIADSLLTIPGVLEASASAAGALSIEFDRAATSEQAIREKLARLDIPNVVPLVPERGDGHAHGEDHDHGDGGHSHEPGKHPPGEHGHSHSHGGILGPNSELIFALTSGLLLLAGFVGGKLFPSAPGWLPTACYIGAYFFGGFFTLREAIDNIRLKRFEIDTLMLVAAAGAAALGAWAEGALLLFLFSLGHALEHHAMGKARAAIEALAKLAPDVATVKRGGELAQIPVAEMEVGDILIVRPNERLAADGFLIAGHSSINQAPVTGESIPVDKRPVDDPEAARAKPDLVGAASRVFAGTINGTGAIEVEVTRRASESTLANVVRLVSEAETRRSPTQRFTDRFERVFVPLVLGLALLLLFAPLVVDEPFRDSFYRAMAVLVAASPCALAIATPSAVLSGVARAARGGVLVKGGAPLELLGSLDAIAFDKTGTLTVGEPRIVGIRPAPGASKAELMAVAVAVEALSDHPLARAIARDGAAHLEGAAPPAATGLHSLTGQGVSATVEGETVLIGKAEMFGSDGSAPLGEATRQAVAELREAGQTTMVVSKGSRDLGVIGLMDTPRPEAPAALARLRKLGIRRMVMISGDHQKVADNVARELGLDQALGDLMPEDKVSAIRKLRTTGEVAMVGDGVNDAPAMANASVGIAMGAAGSDVALETADVALMADDLSHLPFAVGLSRQTRSIIRQNLYVSLGVVALLVPATIMGLGIGPAVALHEGSTLLVVFNALRLLAYRDR